MGERRRGRGRGRGVGEAEQQGTTGWRSLRKREQEEEGMASNPRFGAGVGWWGRQSLPAMHSKPTWLNYRRPCGLWLKVPDGWDGETRIVSACFLSGH